MEFTDGLDIFQKREQLIMLTTGSKNINLMLAGGIETGSTTEILGDFRTGKTQLCHTLAVTCQLPIENGGAEGKCLYIDTEGSFRPERIRSIAERFKLNPDEVLKNIVYSRAYNSEHQLQLLIDGSKLMAEIRFGLVIVDSAISLYHSEFPGLAERCERQIQMTQFFQKLKRMTDEYGVAVVTTRRASISPEWDTISFDPEEPFTEDMNKVIAHQSVISRLQLIQKRNERICKVYSSPCLPNLESKFEIEAGGIVDPKP